MDITEGSCRYRGGTVHEDVFIMYYDLLSISCISKLQSQEGLMYESGKINEF